jgi:N-methylhydantoinase B/oxoprolinase/acetone carboxylase alpha subunit
MATTPAVRVDPVTLEVIRNALPAIANEMSLDLQRTSYNMMIYEVRDYCCAFLDVDGRLISQNIGGVSHFVADLGVVIQDGVAQYGRDGFAPGDVLISNHPRVAGQHLNNMCLYTPCFFDGELIGFAIVRAHWVDVGGMSTGFGAGGQAADPWMEGLQLDQIKLYEAGEPDPKILKLIRDNIRFPESSMGDLRSQLAACRLAERRLEELFRRYGRDVMMASIERIFDETEARCRTIVAQIPDGTYEAEAYFDHDWVERDRPVEIKARVVVQGGDMTIDFTGCSLQRRGGINARTLAGAYIAYKAITTPLEHHDAPGASQRGLLPRAEGGHSGRQLHDGQVPRPHGRVEQRAAHGGRHRPAGARPGAPRPHPGGAQRHPRRRGHLLRRGPAHGPPRGEPEHRGRRLGRPPLGGWRVGLRLHLPGRRAQRAHREH